MILSRVADGLYWMGRYLERAENTTRLLLVTEELSTEVLGLDEDLARAAWLDLRAIFPGFPESEPPFRHLAPLAAASLLGLSIDQDNRFSVFYSLKKARDNARSVREALTLEVFINLNETYRELESTSRRHLADPATFRGAMQSTHRGLMSTVGAIEHTLPRDAGWLFLKLGESLERVFRTVIILRTKLPALVSTEPKVDLPLFYSQWRSLLRGLSCLENYRKVFGARREPIDVLQFLLYDPLSPRSLRYGSSAVKEHLDRISSASELSPPARIVGKLAAELSYQGHDLIRDGQILPFLDHVLTELGRAHDALSTVYFGS
ncbi:MAG TPA: alpha-E domain-containing protein [Methylomirabilota bacterium]|nr:alpha-E domain-containing protein [Methylomirabilota bacterium]